MSRVVRNSFFAPQLSWPCTCAKRGEEKNPLFYRFPPFLPQIVLIAGGEGKESALLQFMAEVGIAPACGGGKEKEEGKEWRWKVQT